MCVVDVWGQWITRCGGTRKRRRCTIQSVPLLQEVIRYAVKQYFYKIGKFTYLNIFTCIIKMMYCIVSLRHRNVSSVWLSRHWRDQLDKELEQEHCCQA
jgi:enoyl reductase-like protein